MSMAFPLTRSARRSEGLSTRSSTRNNIAIPPGGNYGHQQSNIGRKKRPRDSADCEDEAIAKKKARITIEISSRAKVRPKTRSLVITSKPIVSDPAPERSASPKQPETTPPTQPREPSPPSATKKSVNHREKVVNGIKHELNRLQPNAADLNKDEKRKLRSQEGTRFKSELSQYFPDYDEIIGNDPKEYHLLNYDTPIIIIDSAKSASKQTPSPQKSHKDEYPVKDFSDDLFYDLHNAQRVDYSFLDKNYKEEGGENPLSDEYFETIHRKPERQERAIRNTDRGRAQHERDSINRLLEGLQSHEWLKILGVSGITDSKKKEFEPARDHFIKCCQTVLAKFQLWRDEEKRRKVEKEAKEAALAEAEAEAEYAVEEEVEEVVEELGREEDEGDISDGDPPDYSDVDDSAAARQLHEEAAGRFAAHHKHSEKRGRKVSFTDREVEKEFTSFFSKPHLREAALGKHRRSGRTVVAWGRPIPDAHEAEFELPEDYRTEDFLKIHARRKRRDRRISKA